MLRGRDATSISQIGSSLSAFVGTCWRLLPKVFCTISINNLGFISRHLASSARSLERCHWSRRLATSCQTCHAHCHQFVGCCSQPPPCCVPAVAVCFLRVRRTGAFMTAFLATSLLAPFGWISARRASNSQTLSRQPWAEARSLLGHICVRTSLISSPTEHCLTSRPHWILIAPVSSWMRLFFFQLFLDPSVGEPFSYLTVLRSMGVLWREPAKPCCRIPPGPVLTFSLQRGTVRTPSARSGAVGLSQRRCCGFPRRRCKRTPLH